MSTSIKLGTLNINTSQQNSSVFVGESIVTGMDANEKDNTGRGGQYGFFGRDIGNINLNLDGMEIVDGVINDQDYKPNIMGGNS